MKFPWRRTEELFQEAALLPEEERRAFLLSSCGGDLDWALEIESLLGAESRADERIERVIAGTVQLAAREGATSNQSLSQVGPYKVLRELGRGGMSTVYLAERSDEHYRKLVALKVVKRGMDTGEILRRLRQERQILAQLEHPHISRLLDGGNTDEGLPYFVMEYVDGEPIDQYCRRLGLPAEKRLDLFRDVLGAVAYAHRNLVVHRDLKPANILVTGKGEVKLLDFGIAKLLDPEQAAEFGATAAALRFFTLDYASPEQILGKPLNTASDVYSLGALLYELLTGRRPHERKSPEAALSRRDLERAVCEVDPQPPSERIEGDDVAARSLRRTLQGDLDAIVLSALRREENRRYPSVERFAEDLRRYLEGLPVTARQDSVAYRAGKFLQRHRLSVGSGIAALLTVASLVTFYTMRLASERNRAQVESVKSSQVAGFLTGLFEHADPGRTRGDQVTARELLDQGSARIEAELADQPEVQAELMDLMGSVYLDLGLYKEADPMLRVSEELRRQRFGETEEEVVSSRLHRGQWLHAVGRYEEAEALFQELLRIQTSEGAGARSQRDRVLAAYADLLFDQGRPEEAETLFRQALEFRRLHYGAEHPLVATSLNDLGAALLNRGELPAAEQPLREALTLRRKLLGSNHPDLAETFSNLGILRFKRNDSKEALEHLEHALATRRRIYGREHPSVADTLNNLGEISRRNGDLEAAITYLSEALDIVREFQGTHHPAYADSLANLARTVQVRGDHDLAVDLHRQAVTAARLAYGRDQEEVALVLQHLGESLVARGDRVGGEAAYLEALGLRRRLYPQGHWRISFPLFRLGSSHLERGAAASAEPFLAEALQIRQAQRPDHWRTAEVRSWLGSCWVALGRVREGGQLLTQAVAELEQGIGPEAPATEEARQRLHQVVPKPHSSS
ncbi:MAG: serine/threonine-protein kinase [Deltaproteobacteria bacterium]|nr:serine/threonine-protein kinase [Deltaproteobacteria bacterium]